MRTPLYSPHSLSRPGKGGHHGNNKSGEANPYSSLPYATYRRPAPSVPPSFAPNPTANDFNAHHFQTFGRHECFAAPCPITSMSRPDLLMSQTTVGSVGWDGGCRGLQPTSTTQVKATPTGLNLQISCISTQQQQAPLATRVSLSKERLAETRCFIILVANIPSTPPEIILIGSRCPPMCSSAGWRLPTAANLLTLPSLGPAGAQAQNDDGAVFGRECLTLCGILCGAFCNVDSSCYFRQSVRSQRQHPPSSLPPLDAPSSGRC